MTPQVVNAGRIRFHNASDNATTHFDNLRKEYADALNRLRGFVDDAIDTGDFVRASEGVSEASTAAQPCYYPALILQISGDASLHQQM